MTPIRHGLAVAALLGLAAPALAQLPVAADRTSAGMGSLARLLGHRGRTGRDPVQARMTRQAKRRHARQATRGV